MLHLTVLGIRSFGNCEASSFKNKEGQEIAIPAHWLAECEYLEKTYSKLLKGNIHRRAVTEVRADCPIEVTGDFLCEIEIRNDTFRIVRIISKADLNALQTTVKPATMPPRKESKKDEGSL